MHRIVSRRTRLAAVFAAAILALVQVPIPAGAHPMAAQRPWDLKAKAAIAAGADGVHAASLDAAPADPGDDIPTAASLPVSGEATGTLDAFTDVADVYACTIPAHSRIRVTLVSGAPALLADAYVYAGTATSIEGTQALAGTASDDSAETFTYDNPGGTDKPIYLAVVASDGLGGYKLSCETYAIPAGADDDIAGAVGIAGTTSGTLDAETDVDDVYAVHVAAGERLTVDLATDAGLSATAFVYAPGATSTGADLPEWETVGGRAVVDARGGSGGTYYIDVRALGGAGGYTLNASVAGQPAGAWDDVAQTSVLPAASGTVGASLDALADRNDVYAIDLTAGQRVTLQLDSVADADFDLYTYAPGTTSVADAGPLAWATDAAGTERLTLDAATTGRYYIEVRQFSGGGAYTLSWARGSAPRVSTASRTWGPDRYATAIELSKSTFTHADTVVLATGAGFADALAASSLAGVYGSPVLLTPRDALPGGLTAELARLGATKVAVIGGISAVSPKVADALKGSGYAVDRIFGPDRYSTAAAIAARVVAARGSGWNGGAIVVRGDAFADALAASPVAYIRKAPVLLTASDAVPIVTKDAMSSLGIAHVVAVGGTSAVSRSAYNELKTIVGPQGSVERAQGADRYATARALADYSVRLYWADPSYVGVATGLDFPDALGGGAVAGAHGGVLLLTDSRALSPAAAGFLSAEKSGLSQVRLFGGSSVVSDGVLASLRALTTP